MNDYIDKWLYFHDLYYQDKFQEINNLEFVHPDERDFVKNNSTNTFYYCIGNEGDYLKVRSKKYCLRVKPNVIKGYLPNPKFKWGDKVIQVSKPEIEAIIDDFFWHHKDEKYCYYISVNGKRKSNRYYDNDLRLITK
jgi:hypothetical protein